MHPIIPAAVYPFFQVITALTNIWFSALVACYKVDNIRRLTASVAPKLDD